MRPSKQRQIGNLDIETIARDSGMRTTHAFGWLTATFVALITGLHSEALDRQSFSVESPEPGKATLYLYKPVAYGKGKFPVFVGTRYAVTLEKGGFYPVSVDPGNLTLTMLEKLHGGVLETLLFSPTAMLLLPQNLKHTLDISVEAGRVYYVREKPGAAVGLEPVEPATAARDLVKCKLLRPH